MKFIVLDIGGTSIKGGLFENDKLVFTTSRKTNGKLGRGKIILSFNKVISSLSEKADKIDLICVSSAGNINPKSGKCVYANDNLKGWTNFNIKNYIETNYKVPCFVENDACMHLLGQLNSKNINKSIFMVTLGTGVGAVLYKNGKIFYGENFDLGKLQHYVVKENGLDCECGKKGCAEKELSATGLKIYIKETFNKNLTVKDLFVLYKTGNKEAIKLLDEYFEKLIKYIEYIRTLGVDEIIIGGGFIKSRDVFEHYLCAFKDVKYAHHGTLAALYGSFALIRREYGI